MKWAILCFVACSMISGCVAAPDPSEFNYPVNDRLVNAKVITVQVIHVNGAQTPGRSLELAIEGFHKYVAGDVRIVQGEPVTLAADSDGLLRQAQLDPLIAKRTYSGPADITIYVIPGLSDHITRAYLRLNLDGGGLTAVVQAHWLTMRIPPLVSKEKWAHLVIKHELCHALCVPADRSHAWSERHCTRTDCILYPQPDAGAILSAVLHGGPPMDLCPVCQAEVSKSRSAANGKLIEPDQPYDRYTLISRIAELNPDNPQATLFVAGCYCSTKQYSAAVVILRKQLKAHPDDALALNYLAWILATCSDAKIRDGNEAVTLAKHACALSEWKNHNLVDTLAAAYAEAGHFDLAVKTQEKAISLVDEKHAGGLRKHLEIYRSGVTVAKGGEAK